MPLRPGPCDSPAVSRLSRLTTRTRPGRPRSRGRRRPRTPGSSSSTDAATPVTAAIAKAIAIRWSPWVAIRACRGVPGSTRQPSGSASTDAPIAASPATVARFGPTPSPAAPLRRAARRRSRAMSDREQRQLVDERRHVVAGDVGWRAAAGRRGPRCRRPARRSRVAVTVVSNVGAHVGEPRRARSASG